MIRVFVVPLLSGVTLLAASSADGAVGSTAMDGAWWTKVGAIASIVGAAAACVAALGVLWASDQLKLAAWANAQDIVTDYKFTDARAAIQRHFDHPSDPRPDEGTAEWNDALVVCRKMDQLCCLVVEGILSREKLFEYWLQPIGKCFIVVEERWQLITIAREREQHDHKWEAFMTIGRIASQQIQRPQTATGTTGVTTGSTPITLPQNPGLANPGATS